MEDRSKKIPLLLIKNPIKLKPAHQIFSSSSFTCLIISCGAATWLSWIPYEEDAQGNRVPTIVFNGQAVLFHIFAASLMFGFSASFCALFSHHNRPKVFRFSEWCSVLFLIIAAAVLLFSAF
ncbi:hypothetical protein ACH5RR_030349 [Cinchona calisaya]|uniref:Uncharacterized protein n=1 Tax=Cinchona calisaya TaxID=153742 RepID=A0ABD2YZJ2_9GENT